MLLSGAADGYVKVWSLATGEEASCAASLPVAIDSQTSGPVRGLAASSLGFIAVVAADQVTVWRPRTRSATLPAEANQL